MHANKLMVKKAVEALFKVKVDGVQVCRVKGKVKRFGQKVGKRKNWKKAYVTLASGNKIDVLGAE
jgi:large subunit ribosomal protein L23